MSTAPARRTEARRFPLPAGRRTALAGLAVLAFAPLLAGCSARSVPAVDVSAGAQQVISTPGALTIIAPRNDPDAPDLHITGAALVPGPDGNEELRMTLNNEGAATEHLYAASTAAAKAVGLFATSSAGATPQPVGDSGIELDPATTTTFGPGGPRVLLEDPALPKTGTITVTLFFAVAGIVRLTVPAPGAVSAPRAAGTAR